jgi:MFS family permease
MGLILLHVAGEALAYALFMPRQDALMALYVNPQERARTMAVIGALIVAVSSPFGAVAGMLSQVDRRLPFLLNLALLALMGVLAAQLRETPEAERT